MPAVLLRLISMHCSKIIKAFPFLFALGRNGCFKRSNNYTIPTSAEVFPNVRRGLDYMESQAFINFVNAAPGISRRKRARW